MTRLNYGTEFFTWDKHADYDEAFKFLAKARAVATELGLKIDFKDLGDEDESFSYYVHCDGDMKTYAVMALQGDSRFKRFFRMMDISIVPKYEMYLDFER